MMTEKWPKLVLALMCAVMVHAPAQAETLVGLADAPGGQGLVIFDSANPGAIVNVPIMGLADGEMLWGIDRRPLTGELFALSNQNRILTIQPNSGQATVVGAGFTDALNGGSFGFDFNPQIDRIRIVSDADQNFVAHPTTGNANVAVTTPVFYAPGDINEGTDPNVTHHAYDNNFAGTLATQLRAIDTDLDMLVTQANNAGTLGTIGPLGIDATDVGGFDVSESGAAFAVFYNSGDSSALYSIDLNTGAATSLGEVPGVLRGLAAVPEPTSIQLALLALAVGLGMRKLPWRG